MSPAPSTPQHPATATADSTHPPIRHRTHTSITHTRGKESAMNISSETSSITPPLFIQTILMKRLQRSHLSCRNKGKRTTTAFSILTIPIPQSQRQVH